MTSRSSGDDEVIFEIASTCPILSGKLVRLVGSTWTGHIVSRHFEMTGHVESIKKSITDPHYVANSKPGPGDIYAGNLVLVRTDITLRTSKIHVYIVQKQTHYEISSSWFADKHHADVIWRLSDKTGGDDA